MTPPRFYPRQWLRWITGRLGLTERYDIITIDLKSEYLEEAKELSSDKIVIDSTFSFDDVKQAYEQLVCCKMFCSQSRISCCVSHIADSSSKLLEYRSDSRQSYCGGVQIVIRSRESIPPMSFITPFLIFRIHTHHPLPGNATADSGFKHTTDCAPANMTETVICFSE